MFDDAVCSYYYSLKNQLNEGAIKAVTGDFVIKCIVCLFMYRIGIVKKMTFMEIFATESGTQIVDVIEVVIIFTVMMIEGTIN